MSYQSLGGGIAIMVRLIENQIALPRAHIRLGKVWVNGGKGDSFSGFNLDFGLGFKMKVTNNLQGELQFTYSEIELNRVTINDNEDDLTSNITEGKFGLLLRAYYYINF